MPVVALLSLDGHLDEATALALLSQLKGLPAIAPDAAALILRVRCGGGSLGAAQALAEGLLMLRQELGLPIVGLVIETALSAGFYVLQACDHIVAAPGAILGGCGAIIRLVKIGGLLERFGLFYTAIANGPHKDSIFPLASSLNDEQRNELEALVADHSRQFFSFLKERRPITTRIRKRLADGQLLSGAEALRLKLIDRNGGLFEAISQAAALLDVEQVDIQPIDLSNQNSSPIGNAVSALLLRFGLN